ncbi:MAG: glycosyltransferase [Sedimentisphaerales bacterium]|nr:glycosyltransferase [Sedimentisphaerales bacterium]
MTLETDAGKYDEHGRENVFEKMNDYEKGLKFADAGDYRQALEYIQKHLQATGGDAQALNDAGAILHCLGRSEDAIMHLVNARNLQSDSAEIVWNLVEAYLATGRADEASLLFDDMDRMNILNADVLNRTANVFLNQNNKAGAIEMLLRSLEVSPQQEILLPMVQVIRSKRPKMAFFCGGDGMTFLNDIYEFAQQRFETRLFEGKTEDELYELMKWSDISWFEWCTDLAVIGSRKPKVCENIVRLHRYEAYCPWPGQVNWRNVDTLITVGNRFVREALISGVPDIENRTSIVKIPNGVNLEKYEYTERGPGKNIAFLSNLRAVKNPAFILQCMQKLHFINPEYRLFFAGHFQDAALEQYIRHMVNALGLADVVFFDGWQEDVCSWLRDKHYIVSTSIIESQGMGLLEAMACGVKPVIHNFPGAEDTFGSEFLFNISEEFCDHILSPNYKSYKYRMFIEENYSLRQQLAAVNSILTRLENKIYLKQKSTLPGEGSQKLEPQTAGINS